MGLLMPKDDYQQWLDDPSTTPDMRAAYLRLMEKQTPSPNPAVTGGLLGKVFSVADTVKRNVKGLLADPTGYVGLLGTRMAEDAKASNEAQKAAWDSKDPNKMAQAAIDATRTATGFAPIAMTAWHGSPHKFDKFSLDKIGTGEGAQAYGHGLYLAESPEVAANYSNIGRMKGAGYGSSTPINAFEYNGQPLFIDGEFNHDLPRHVADFTRRELGALTSIGVAQDEKTLFAKILADKEYANTLKERYGSELFNDLQQGFKATKPSSLYKTDIPDEAVARFLDWDKPLSQQAPEVQKVLANYADADKRKIIDLVRRGEQPDGFGIFKSTEGFSPIINGEVVGSGAQDLTFKSMDEALGYISNHIPSTEPTAASIYRTMVNEHGGADAISQSQVSNWLHQQGIPGIRYLDGGSRSAGQGSSNFVVFDPEMIRILERNGQATGAQPWKPGEWQGLLSP